jgi:hypothetical protein
MTTSDTLKRLGVTLGDLEAIEGATGLNILSYSEHDEIPIAMVIGLAWVTMRKTQPDLTIEDVRTMDLGDLDLDTLAASVGKAKGAPRRRSGSGSGSRVNGAVHHGRSTTPRPKK